MTRDEAIDWLCRLRSSIDGHLFDVMPKEWFSSSIEALGFAIDSLTVDEQYQLDSEKVECEAEDCISREQALKELKESAEHHANDSREKVLLRRDRDIIRALPSVTPQEPKIGHWIKSNIGGAKVCSVCNAHMGLSSFKFCPSCGAKMVEPQESEG